MRGLEALRAVRDRVAVRVAMDETAAEHGSLSAGVADAVCLKVSRCGGISGLLAQAALVRSSGADVYVASTYDGPVGIAAGLHAAAALRARGKLLPCGLSAGAGEPPAVAGGRLAVPPGPGLLGAAMLDR